MKENIFKWGVVLASTISFIGLIVGLSVTYTGSTIFDSVKNLKFYKGAGLLQSHIVFVLAGSIASGLLGVCSAFVGYKLFRGDMDANDKMIMIRVGILAIVSFAVAIAVFACVGDLKNDVWVAKQLLKSNLMKEMSNIYSDPNDPYGLYGSNI